MGRHSRRVVFTGAYTALVIMTILSTGLGLVLPNLISRDTVRHFAVILYTCFGCRLIWIATRGDTEEIEEEIKDVEAQLHGDDDSEKDANKTVTTMKRLLSGVANPVFLEALVFTFVAEWGDRSQLATIALATHYDAV